MRCIADEVEQAIRAKDGAAGLRRFAKFLRVMPPDATIALATGTWTSVSLLADELNARADRGLQ